MGWILPGSSFPCCKWRCEMQRSLRSDTTSPVVCCNSHAMCCNQDGEKKPQSDYTAYIFGCPIWGTCQGLRFHAVATPCRLQLLEKGRSKGRAAPNLSNWDRGRQIWALQKSVARSATGQPSGVPRWRGRTLPWAWDGSDSQWASYLLDLICISFSGMNLSLGLKRLSSRGKIRLMLEESVLAEILNVISRAVKICYLWLNFWWLKAGSIPP